MNHQPQTLFVAKPTLRRAIFFLTVYIAAVVYGYVETGFDARLTPIWIICLGLAFSLFTFAVLRRWTTKYIIDSEEVRSLSGILARRVVVVPLTRVSNALANQSIVDRILGIVNLRIDTAGGTEKELVMSRILKTEAIEAASIIRQLRRNDHPRTGQHRHDHHSHDHHRHDSPATATRSERSRAHG